MAQLNRRRFLAISAATAACFGAPLHARDYYQWRGIAMGSAATITLNHPDAQAIADRMQAEISRLEDVFSLYRSGSALSRLNAQGHLKAPPFELLECLSLAGQVNMASGGRFDPTVQPLWAAYAKAYAAQTAPAESELAAILPRIGWAQVQVDAGRITLGKGQALTLNGIAQGFVADKIAALLRAQGLTNVLVDTGEIAAIGAQMNGEAWPVTILNGPSLRLRDRALATSAPLGTAFDKAGQIGHILDPKTGQPAVGLWSQASVSCASAGLADALSTATCLMPDPGAIAAMLSGFKTAKLESLIAV